MSVEWTPAAVKDMRRITERDRGRIIAKIDQYAQDPASLANQIVAMTGSSYRRLRVGRYRVIIDIQRDTATVMVIMRVRHRRAAYG
ncbi:MAG: type II toxin-antitoxin system RelE/ParE family toxin [Chloroflexota bacterium]|nr:type II toxin-antitoxin system RelE/ParE family toxin [Chloroflexota bacterium]